MQASKRTIPLLFMLAAGGPACRTPPPLVQGGGSGGTGYTGGSTGTDHMLFMGDSIHLAAMEPTVDPNLSEDIAALDPGRVLTYDNECVGGSASVNGVIEFGSPPRSLLDWLLIGHPTAKYFAICYGRNDIDTNTTEAFRNNMQTMIDRVIAVGKIPVIPTIVHSLNPGHVGQELYNQVVIDLVAQNNLPSGPDLWTWFLDHPEQLGPDGAHPNAAGNVAINQLWAVSMLAILQGS